METVYQRAFQSLFILELLVQRVRVSSIRQLKMERAAKMDPLQAQVLLCLSPEPVIVLLKSIHNASSTPSHLTTSDFSVIHL